MIELLWAFGLVCAGVGLIGLALGAIQWLIKRVVR
jgi:hypothetical protein